MSEDPTRFLEVAREAGRAAAAVCRAVLEAAPAAPDAMAKLGKEPVTVADYGSQAVVLRALAAAFPEHGVIAEEGSEALRAMADEGTARQVVELVRRATGEEDAGFDRVCAWIDHEGVPGADYVWALDPIDGTKGFLRREQYAVAIGLLHRGRPFAGVLVCPNLPVSDEPEAPRGALFCALRGQGCTLEPLDGGPARPVRVSEVDDPAGVRVLGSVESAHGDPALVRAVLEDLGLGGGMVRLDSQCKYGVVARGGAEVYLRPRSRPDYRENVWDHAAGAIVVEEAGGRVTDLDGCPLDFSKGRKLVDNRGVLATNGLVHDLLLESLARCEARAAD